MNKEEIKQFTSWLGQRSYVVRLERFGIQKIREIARANGKKGGRPKNQPVKPEVARANKGANP